MKSKIASKQADILSMYLDENGRYDIRKSEKRRGNLKEKPTGLCKFDLLRNKDMHEGNAITRLINTVFKGNI